MGIWSRTQSSSCACFPGCGRYAAIEMTPIVGHLAAPIRPARSLIRVHRGRARPAPNDESAVKTSYSSPFSWRYGRPEMRALFSEETKRRMWRRMWLELARAQTRAKLVTEEELADLRRYVDAVDIPAADAIEKEIHHDLMAELRVYASQAKLGGGKLHLGATSMDIEDNVETARIRLALSMLCTG